MEPTSRPTRRRPLLRRPLAWIVAGVGVVVLVAALLIFEPYKLFINQSVNEATPAAPITGVPSPDSAVSPVVIARGDLISHEHATTGTVQVLKLADGSRVLRLENLDTTNGPVLKVWLADSPVLPGTDGWHVFDKGRYIDLGGLKGNKGSSNYPIPAGVELAQYRSVSIWCERFAVSFGAAALTPTGA